MSKLRSTNPNANQSGAPGLVDGKPAAGLSAFPLGEQPPADRLSLAQELYSPTDEDGNPLPPLITKEQFLRLIGGPTDDGSPFWHGDVYGPAGARPVKAGAFLTEAAARRYDVRVTDLKSAPWEPGSGHTGNLTKPGQDRPASTYSWGDDGTWPARSLPLDLSQVTPAAFAASFELYRRGVR